MKQNGVARKVSGTFEKRALGVIVMLRRVLIRLLWNSSAGDGTVSLTGVSRYVVRALVISMPLALFFRICSNCSNCPFCSSIALMVVWAGCYVPNIKLVTKASEVVRSKARAIVRNGLLRQSKLPEDIVQYFCDSFCCLALKGVIGEKAREVIDCN